MTDWQIISVFSGEGYRDGVYSDIPGAAFIPFTSANQTFKYAPTNPVTSSVWAEWVLSIPESGHYEIEVWVTGEHATTRNARYHIHGLAGDPSKVTVPVQQSGFDDQWVSLGMHEFDASHPDVGKINMTNFTGEPDKEIAFTAFRWRKHVDTPLADGFDSPVGIEDPTSLTADGLWLDVARGRPQEWYVSVDYNQRYRDSSGGAAIHTGLDFNRNPPGEWNKDAGAPVYAIASGEVTYAKFVERYWGNVVVIRHDPMVPGGPYVYTRSAHLQDMFVEKGQRVERGQKIGTVGANTNRFGTPVQGNEHLHFDLSPTDALGRNPLDWPKLDQGRVLRDYLDPKPFIAANRPPR